MATLEGAGLGLSYEGVPLFSALDIRIGSGETLGVIGRSGCGKSSLLNVLAGIHRPDTGRVMLDGEDITGKPGHCSLMPQDNLLLPWRTLIDNAALALEITGTGKAEARVRAEAWLPRFDLEGKGALYPHELSGGMQQRAALLRSCLHASPVLLLDEPFAALDALTRMELRSWFAELVGTLGLVAVLVTHDIDEVLQLASRIICFRRAGQVDLIDVPASERDEAAARKGLLDAL